MSWLLDVIILVILAVSVFIGWKKGFIESAVSAVSGIASLIAALLLSRPAALALKGLELPDAAKRIIAFAAIYLLTKLVLRLCSNLLTKLFDRPVLRTLNKGFGIALNVVFAVVEILIFCFVVNVSMDVAALLGSDIFKSLAPESTILFKFFSQIDVFSFIL